MSKHKNLPFNYKNIYYDKNGKIEYQSISPFIMLYKYQKKFLVNSDQYITKEPEITLVIDYPLKQSFEFKIRSQGGFTLDHLIQSIIQLYKKIYKKEEESVGHRTKSYAEAGYGHLMNRMPSDGPYGIWGHFFEDLSLESITFSSGKYYLGMGS
jgi:hypothetical protein